jgi:hypothetical protein
VSTEVKWVFAILRKWEFKKKLVLTILQNFVCKIVRNSGKNTGTTVRGPAQESVMNALGSSLFTDVVNQTLKI